jgi:Protein of unknown function (DUF1488)
LSQATTATKAGLDALDVVWHFGVTMPLTSASEKPVFKRDRVRFLMKDGPHEVTCQISHQDLLFFGRTVGMSDTALVFAGYREEIERAASDRWDCAGRGDYEIIVITAADLLGRAERRED